MSTSDTFTKQQWQDQEALHRFQLISPLLQTGLDDARRLQLRRTIADENNISVRTLYRYEKAFAEKQFAGLRPADRENDVHRSFRKTSSFFWNRQSNCAGKCRNGQLPRSFTFWKRKVLWHLVF